MFMLLISAVIQSQWPNFCTIPSFPWIKTDLQEHASEYKMLIPKIADKLDN